MDGAKESRPPHADAMAAAAPPIAPAPAADAGPHPPAPADGHTPAAPPPSVGKPRSHLVRNLLVLAAVLVGLAVAALVPGPLAGD